MEYKINEVTPESMRCGLASVCPAIYEGLKETTSQEMMCTLVTYPSTYEATREGEEVYLVIGKVIKPSEVGLEGLAKKIGEDEALIEVPRRLIDNKGK